MLVPVLTGFLTDWWWFGEIGYRIGLLRELTTRILLFLGVGRDHRRRALLESAGRTGGLVPYLVVLQLGESAPRLDITAALRRLSGPVSLVFVLLAGLAAAGAWALVLRAIYPTPFRITDPVFSRDIGFYVFTLPGLASGRRLLHTRGFLLAAPDATVLAAG